MRAVHESKAQIHFANGVSIPPLNCFQTAHDDDDFNWIKHEQMIQFAFASRAHNNNNNRKTQQK